MKLITVEAKIASDSIRKSIDVFNSQASTVRGMNGCESYAIYEAPGDDDSILIVQKWTSMDAFDIYRDSDVFAAMGQGLKPMMTAPPVTTIAEID